jgi:hypothetical protein
MSGVRDNSFDYFYREVEIKKLIIESVVLFALQYGLSLVGLKTH